LVPVLERSFGVQLLVGTRDVESIAPRYVEKQQRDFSYVVGTIFRWWNRGRVLDPRNLATSGALGGKLRCANEIGHVQSGTFATEIDIGELQIQSSLKR
jgi:hypothetical protein